MEEEVARATQELPWAGMHDDMTQVIACHAALAQEQAKAAWCEQAKEQAREIETSLLGQRAQAAEAFEATGSQHAAALTLRYDAAVKALRDTHQELRGYQLGHDRDVSAMGILLEDYKVGTKPRIMPPRSKATLNRLSNWSRPWKRPNAPCFTQVAALSTLALPPASCCANWSMRRASRSHQR